MNNLSHIISVAKTLTDDNQIGAFITDSNLIPLWVGEHAERFFPGCANGVHISSFAPTLDIEGFIGYTRSMSMAETVTRNIDGARVAVFCIDTHGLFLFLLSSGFQHGNIAVNALIHDIKNPIVAIKHAIGALRVCTDKEQQALLLQILQNQCDRMTKMTGDLLSIWNKSTLSDNFKKQNLSVLHMVEKLCASVGVSLSASGITLTFSLPDEPLTVYGDPDSIERALLNIICNAIRYAKSTISVKVTSASGRVRIYVDNDGAKLSASADSVFELFEKGYDGGSGIGLYVTKSMLDAHDGTIELVQSELDGTCFMFSLPLVNAVALKTPSVSGDELVAEVVLAALYLRKLLKGTNI